MMGNDSAVLLIRNPAEYDKALAALEIYVDCVPKPGTMAAVRFERLTRAVLAYEDLMWPLPPQKQI